MPLHLPNVLPAVGPLSQEVTTIEESLIGRQEKREEVTVTMELEELIVHVALAPFVLPAKIAEKVIEMVIDNN